MTAPETSATAPTEPDHTARRVRRVRRRRKAGLWLLLSLTMFLAVIGDSRLGGDREAPNRAGLAACAHRGAAGQRGARTFRSVRRGRSARAAQRACAGVAVGCARGDRRRRSDRRNEPSASAGFLPGPLLRGDVVLREAQVSGVFVTLRRDREGRLGLALGPAFRQGAGGVPDIATLIGQVDDALSRPVRLSAQRRGGRLTVRLDDDRVHRGWTADGGACTSPATAGCCGSMRGWRCWGAATPRRRSSSMPKVPSVGDDLAFGVTLDNLAAKISRRKARRWPGLRALQAPISGALRGSMRSDGGLGALNATLQIGAGRAASPITRLRHPLHRRADLFPV